MSVVAEPPRTIAEATADQPAARLALAAATAAPSHAYLFAGPPGSGKRAAARALAAELLADGAPDPGEARRRALADPSPHPDLVWLRPPGTQHLVEEVREQVIAAAAYRPFEGERRVFVIEAADAMAEESQNALLKTLEEPAPFAHLLLISAEPEALLETVRSRCQPVHFARLGPDAVEERLAAGLADGEERPSAEEVRAAARLSDGDPARAAFLLEPEGRALRAAAEACVRAAATGALAGAPQREIIATAEAAGERASAKVLAAAADAEDGDPGQGREARRRERDAADAAKRSGRRARNESLDLGLALIATLLRDLAATAEGAGELALNPDVAPRLASEVGEVDPRRARRGAELVMDTRRRLRVHVGEELALEALLYRLEYLLSG